MDSPVLHPCYCARVFGRPVDLKEDALGLLDHLLVDGLHGRLELGPVLRRDVHRHMHAAAVGGEVGRGRGGRRSSSTGTGSRGSHVGCFERDWIDFALLVPYDLLVLEIQGRPLVGEASFRDIGV